MTIKFIQQNVCGKDYGSEKWNRKDFELLLDTIKEREADVLLLTEFFYKEMVVLLKEKFSDYTIVLPKKFTDEDKDNYNINSACALLYKKGDVEIDSNLHSIDNMLDLRYICCDLKYQQKRIMKVLALYIPQTFNNNRMKTKKEMLISAKKYVFNNLDSPIFVVGDMNSDVDYETTSCISEFKNLYSILLDSDLKKEPTWNGKRLDYALISKDRGISAETYPFSTNSDHCGLETILTLNATEKI